MKISHPLQAFVLLLILSSCDNGRDKADAYGQFEVTAVTISAMTHGEILALSADEGLSLEPGHSVGLIDTTQLHLQKLEILANQKAIESQYGNILAEIRVHREQLSNLRREEKRISNMLESNAATPKQLDDIQGQIAVVQQQIQTVESRNPSITAQIKALEAKLDNVEKSIRDAQVINPIKGVVLTKFAEAHEIAAPGKPLYRIADLDTLDVRAFIPESRLHSIKVGQHILVKVDGAEGEIVEHPGYVSWISEEAEFTPKTIQTREERVNLVYAFKVRVANDGTLKIGMPAEVWLKGDSDE